MSAYKYFPEGHLLMQEENQKYLSSMEALQFAYTEQRILEAIAICCDAEHNLIVNLGFMHAIIPRIECAIGIAEGQTREIAILSCVGKPVCFVITKISENAVILSRRIAQERALSFFLHHLQPGDIIPAHITRLESFGAFVDIGCGVISFIGIENISVSRIRHPNERFSCGQNIFAAVLYTDPKQRRIYLTHRELLGTWAQNAAHFHAGETVCGTVRSIEDYGVFIELAPNLSGLAEKHSQLQEGDTVSVYIKSISPERMKIKLSVIDILPKSMQRLHPLQYYISSSAIQNWIYTPPCCHSKYIATKFS